MVRVFARFGSPVVRVFARFGSPVVRVFARFGSPVVRVFARFGSPVVRVFARHGRALKFITQDRHLFFSQVQHIDPKNVNMIVLKSGLIHAHVQTYVALLQSPRFSVATLIMYCLR